jgi:hypothetical protein
LKILEGTKSLSRPTAIGLLVFVTEKSISGFWLLASAFDGSATATIMTREKPGKIDNDQKPRRLRDIIDAVDTL